MSDYFETRERLRRKGYAGRPIAEVAKQMQAEQIGGSGFITQVAGRVVLTAPASMLTDADQLPKELAERWEKAAGGNPYMTWLQGRYVEAEKANRNGAYWSTEDLQFGEMSVKHGPLNWLHENETVIGTIADNALIHPPSTQQAMHETASSILGYDAARELYGTSTNGITVEQLARYSTTANVFGQPMPRPYMAAVSAMWNWVRPEKVDAVRRAADQNKLWYSMECVGREISCVSDETHTGCGKSFEYVAAMTQPSKTCECMQARSSARRIVDPSFLGGAVIVPPAAPGWGAANLELMSAVAEVAGETYTAGAGLKDDEWVHLMAHVLKFISS